MMLVAKCPRHMQRPTASLVPRRSRSRPRAGVLPAGAEQLQGRGLPKAPTP